MVWRHPSSDIDDPRPAAGSFSMADVYRLSAHVVKMMDMPEGVLVLSELSRVWKSHICDLVFRGADGNVIGIHDFLCLPEWTANVVILDPTPKDLAVSTPSSKILAKAEASQKRKASASGATLSHVAKRTRSALDQSSGSTTRPSLFVGDDDGSDDDDDDDACGGSSATPAAEVSNPRDSRGKGIMADDAVARSVGVNRPRGSSGHFTLEEWDAPYRPTFRVLTKEVFKDPAVCKTVVDQFPTPREMVRVESLSDDQLIAKMSVLHCMMISHGRELLALYHGLNQSHYEYMLSEDSRVKGYEDKVSILTGLELQVSTLKKQVFGLNDKLSSSDSSFAKSKAKGKEKKKKIKSLTKSLDNMHAEVARLFTDLNRANALEAEKDEEILRLKATPPNFSSFFRGQFQGLVQKFLASDEFSKVQGELLSLAASAGFERGLSMHRVKDEFADMLKKMANFMHVILQLEPKKLARPTNVPTSRDARVSPPIAKDSTVTPASKSLELSTNVAPTSFGTSHVLDDATEVTVVGSERVSFGLTDVVVALFACEKRDGSLPSSIVDEEAVANPSGV
ncbi:hypothetical protein Tco_0163045 [Tanacetum coccineum]